MKVGTLIDLPPDADAMTGLEAIAERDPVVWCMINRRIKGEPIIFDNSRMLTEESLGELRQRTIIDSDYERELRGRLQRHRPWQRQPMRDQHLHKVYEKSRQVGVTEVSENEVIHFLAHHPGTKWITCVPDDVEILTRRGWKLYGELVEDDQALALDNGRGTTRWEPILEVRAFDYRGFLSSVGPYPFHCTANHRWPVEEKTTVNGKVAFKRKIVEAWHLKQQHTLTRLAPHDHDGAESVLSARHAALLGWVVTDGHQWMTGTKPNLNTVMMEISQNARKHLAEVERLSGVKAQPCHAHTDAPTIAVGAHGGRIVGVRDPDAKNPRERYLYGDQYRVRLARKDVDAILFTGYKSKKDLPALVTRLSPEAAEAMWDAMLKAEGNRARNSTHFTQLHGPILEAFQILCTLTGRAANLNARGCYIIEAKSRSSRMRAVYKDSSKRDRYYIGKVWCPRTPSGTWCMRYRGRVVFTGNTWPREKQLLDFSNTRVAPAFADTLRMAALVGTPWQGFTRRVGDSYWLFRSAWESNLGEGEPADGVSLDEKDRMRDKIESAFREALKSSKWGFFREMSTPTLPRQGIDLPFSKSDQMTWLVKCKKCGEKQPVDHRENIVQVKDFPLGTQELPPESYAFLCRKQRCRGELDRVYSGEWVAKYPDRKHIRGYAISQLMAAWISATQVMQDKIDMRFPEIWLNYVVGVPAGSEMEMLNDADFDKSCAGHQLYTSRTSAWSHVTWGADWGQCHDAETRVLTERGFVFFKDLGATDKVAQWDAETRKMTFVKPSKITIKSYDGDLIHFTGKGVDTMVTPEHRMRVGNRWTGRWETETASAIAERDHATLVGSVSWEGTEKNSFALPALSRSPGYPGCDIHEMSMDVWLEFLGYYLSEGGLCFSRAKGRRPRPSCIKMSQRESVHADNVRKMRNCLQATGLRYSEFPNQNTSDVNWTIYGKQLWSWIQENVGDSCGNKRVPREFLSLSRRQLRILFDAMMLGDGGYRKHGGLYRSTSPGLCEDFQEICIRLGFRASVYLQREAAGNKSALYCTSWTKGKDRFWARVDEHVERVPYRGKVYCCTVPSGYIVTERNGHVAYHGNCNWVTVIGRNKHNQRLYLLGLAVFEDTPVELESARRVLNYVQQFSPDMGAADAGYGKDRNAMMLRELCPNGNEGRFWVQWYNQSTKHSKTFVPEWSDEERARVTVDRTIQLKNVCRVIKEREIGLPHLGLPEMELFQRHTKSLVPFREIDDETKQVVETIKTSGEDHLAHCLGSALLCMERVAKTSRFNFSFE